MQQANPTYVRPFTGGQFDAVSPLGLTAVAAALHVAIFAGRVSAQTLPRGPVMHMVWQIPAGGQIDARDSSFSVILYRRFALL